MAQSQAGSSFWSFKVWPALAYAIAILVVGSLPSTPSGAQQLGDKTLHFLGFGLLAGLACRAVRQLSPELSSRGVLLYGLGVSAGLGALLELWQALLTYRSCEFLDWVADVLGAGLAVAIRAALQALSKPSSSTA
jgi:VanZ family protein